MKVKIFIFTLFFLASFILETTADTVYLKNGRKIEGKIRKKNEEGAWLDLEGGTIKFRWEAVDSIKVLNPDGTIEEIRQKEGIEPEKSAENKLVSGTGIAQEVLVKAGGFIITRPLDWQEESKSGLLMLKGPFPAGSGRRPFIVIREEKDEAVINSMEKTKEAYYRWKDLPAFKENMLAFLMGVFEKNYGGDMYKFVSCDYGEKEDFIMQRIVSLDKARNMKICDTTFITKTQPAMACSLIFMCPEEHYEEYIPAFEKCLNSFSLKK